MAYGMLADAEEQARAAAPGIEVFHAVVTGTPLAVLEDESRHAALAVLASRGHSRFTHRLGSTAAHLAAHGHCPLMVVRGRSAPTGPVLLAVDGSPTGRKAVEFAFTEAALRKAPLLALHVWNTWSERAYEGPGDPLNAMVTDIGHLREAEQHLLAESVTPWQEAFPQVTVEQRLVRSRIRPALIDASREAQLVVAGSRGHGALHGLLLGSVSQVLLHHSRCPVAVVHGMQ
jgi:nucleotide-binding universal stress UspA family protein